VQLSGFRTFTRPDIPVTLNSVTRADAGLHVGQLTESVNVGRTSAAAGRSEEPVNLLVSMNRNYQSP